MYIIHMYPPFTGMQPQRWTIPCFPYIALIRIHHSNIGNVLNIFRNCIIQNGWTNRQKLTSSSSHCSALSPILTPPIEMPAKLVWGTAKKKWIYYICWSVFTKSIRFSARFWHFYWKFMSCICQCNISVIRRPYIYIDDGLEFGCEAKSATDILVMVLFLSKHGTMLKMREAWNVYTLPVLFFSSTAESFIEAIRACNHKILFNVFFLFVELFACARALSSISFLVKTFYFL